jgi:hypothetical protein
LASRVRWLCTAYLLLWASQLGHAAMIDRQVLVSSTAHACSGGGDPDDDAGDPLDADDNDSDDDLDCVMPRALDTIHCLATCTALPHSEGTLADSLCDREHPFRPPR